MSWFERGFDNLEEKKIFQVRTPRFWLAVDESREIVFLDDEPFRFYEHQLYIDGSWRNWFTCLGREKCPLCNMLNNVPYYVGMLTIIDLTEWTDRKGVIHRREKKLFPAKIETLNLLKVKKAKVGLKGVKFEVMRVGDRSPNVGNNFEFLEKVDLSVFNETPYNYEEIFKPNPQLVKAVVEKMNMMSMGSPFDEENGKGY